MTGGQYTDKDTVQNLVLIDRDLSLNSHVKGITKSTFYHLKNTAMKNTTHGPYVKNSFMPLCPAGLTTAMVFSQASPKRPNSFIL